MTILRAVRTILIVCGLVWTSAPARAETITIAVGGIDKLSYLPARLTERLGYFADEGLDVQLIGTAGGVQAENQLVAGQAQAVVGFFDHLLDLQSKGKRLLAVVQMGKVPNLAMLVATTKGDAVHEVKDLKGMTLGVTALGSSTAYLTQYLALKAGLPRDGVHLLAAGEGNIFIASMQHGAIDAGMTNEPTISRLLKTGQARMLVDLRTEAGSVPAMGGHYVSTCLYLQPEWIAAHRPEVQKLVNAFVRTLRWMDAHSAEEIAEKMPRDYYAGDKALYVEALVIARKGYTNDGRMPADGLATVYNVIATFNPALRTAKVDPALNTTSEFVDAVR